MICVFFCGYDVLFKETATTEIYTYCHTLSRLDAPPILGLVMVLVMPRSSAIAGAPEIIEPPQKATVALTPIVRGRIMPVPSAPWALRGNPATPRDRKSTRLNSSH